MLVLTFLIAFATLFSFIRRVGSSTINEPPVAVNYHFTRQCNKTCSFCFHTATTSYVLEAARAKKGLAMLKADGMRKINFAGGEPFLYQKFLGQMIDFCKQDLHLESVSIVTNGTLVDKKFLSQHGGNIDILAVSCDSFIEVTNIAIGRGDGNNVKRLEQIRVWCSEYGIKFKINTVVCDLNWEEDMNRHITRLQPSRWKCFQVLLVAGENESEQRLRDSRKRLISSDQFNSFIERHRGQQAMVPESNELMAQSYLILDEYMRFLNRDGREPSPPILDVGVESALEAVTWDTEAFKARGGMYDWARDKPSCSRKDQDLEW